MVNTCVVVIRRSETPLQTTHVDFSCRDYSQRFKQTRQRLAAFLSRRRAARSRARPRHRHQLKHSARSAAPTLAILARGTRRGLTSRLHSARAASGARRQAIEHVLARRRRDARRDPVRSRARPIAHARDALGEFSQREIIPRARRARARLHTSPRRRHRKRRRMRRRRRNERDIRIAPTRIDVAMFSLRERERRRERGAGGTHVSSCVSFDARDASDAVRAAACDVHSSSTAIDVQKSDSASMDVFGGKSLI